MIGTRTCKHYTDSNSAVFMHGEIAKHGVDDSNFKILDCGYGRCKHKKIVEAYIGNLKPNLNGPC